MPFEVLGQSLRTLIHLDDSSTLDLLMVSCVYVTLLLRERVYECFQSIHHIVCVSMSVSVHVRVVCECGEHVR